MGHAHDHDQKDVGGVTVGDQGRDGVTDVEWIGG